MKKSVVKKTVSLQADVWEYVSGRAEGNASALINKAVRSYQRRELRRELVEGYKAMASDPTLAEDLALWDTTLLDGLSDEDHPARCSLEGPV